jgi:hypothetical protein
MPEIQLPVPPTDLVRMMLAAAGLRPSPAEIETMAVLYAGFRAAADRLYPLVYDDDPAHVFDPVPMFRAGRGD